jgi:receptor-type tyrosine-protein phosphatase R
VNLPIINNDPLSAYINANYVAGFKCDPKAYIAAQGPMSNTIDDFWRMVCHERVSCIVMITQLVERNKNKCELYFPEEQGLPVHYDNVLVTVKQVTYCQDYELRQLQVDDSGTTRFISHYWYTAWPDHNLPESPHALVDLVRIVDSERDDDPAKGPVLVHCSAGVGRTGCFLALSIGIKQIDLNGFVDIVKIICNLRMDRGGMIQTLEQYEFIYQVLAYYCVYYKKYQFGGGGNNNSSSLSLSSHCSIVDSLNSSRSPESNSAFSFSTQ